MQQQFREPRIDLSSEFHSLDTMRELPAMPKESSYSGVSNPYPNNPCPYWHAPLTKRPIDRERMAARATWTYLVLFSLAIISICLWNVVVMVATKLK